MLKQDWLSLHRQQALANPVTVLSDVGYYLFIPITITYIIIFSTDLEVRVRFPTLPDFLRSRGSGTGFTQPREYN
jgi:hypothetical protein